MGIFDRIKKIVTPAPPPEAPKSVLTLGPGDIVEVSLVTYEVTGRARNSQRNAVLLTLQDGRVVKYLYVEEREKLDYELYDAVDGRLEQFDEVPTTIELDERMYYLEEQYEGRVITVGRTPFLASGEQMVWRYQSDDRKLLRIEWQEGRFVFYEGEDVLPADVKILRGGAANT